VASLTKGQKVRLGVFVATGLAVLIAATVVLAGRKFTEQLDTYSIRYSNKAASFSGLSVGSDVTYSGIKIGRVESLAVARDDVSVIEVGISVAHATPIAADSTASLGTQGITGMKYIDISRGSQSAKLRQPGDRIPPGESMIDNLSARAQSIGERLDALLVNLQAMTGTTQQKSLDKVFERVDSVLAETSGILVDNRPTIAAILQNAQQVTEDMTTISHNLAQMSRTGVVLTERADHVMANLETASQELKQAAAPQGEVAVAVGKVAKLVDGLNMVVVRSQGDIDVTLRHLRDAAADLRDFAQAVKDNPTLLMFTSEQGSDRRIGK